MIPSQGRLARKIRPFVSYYAAVGHEYRLAIVFVLTDDPQSVKSLSRYLDIAPSLVIHHLRILMKNGWVKRRGEKKDVMYYLERQAFYKWSDLFKDTLFFRQNFPDIVNPQSKKKT